MVVQAFMERSIAGRSLGIVVLLTLPAAGLSAFAQQKPDSSTPAPVVPTTQNAPAAQNTQNAPKQGNGAPPQSPATPQIRNEAQGIMAPRVTGPDSVQNRFHYFGSFKARVEDYNYFSSAKADGAYVYGGALLRGGVRRETSKDDILLELALPTLFNPPTRANAPNPQGALGQGANYFANNGGHFAELFPKQAYTRLKQLGSPANSLRLGRFEFVDGGELRPADVSLAYLKANRIANRLISPNPFSYIGRSFDGLEFSSQTKDHLFTGFGAVPTRGGYDLNGSDDLPDVKIAYLAATLPRSSPDALHVSDSRLFGAFYEDGRGTRAIKTDNRPQALRQKDGQAIDIYTIGGHDTRLFPVGKGRMDTLFWMAAQGGRWGAQSHGAYAADVELGYQPRDPRLHSWYRAGYYYGSGDGNPNNNRHGTFFPILPSGRTYARFPFFATSNLQDAFAELILRPAPRVLVRSDIRKLALADNHDLYYTGSGVYSNSNFGYTGRASANSHDLATLYDTSVDYQVTPATLLILYAAYAKGGSVLSSLYKSSDASFGYLEIQQRF